MSHPPPSSPPGNPPRKHGPSAQPLHEDFADFEGDPTSINQIPQAQQGRASAPLISGSQPPGQFASASPSLSHIGSPSHASGQQYGTNPGLSGSGLPAQPHAGHPAGHQAHAASHPGHQSQPGHQSRNPQGAQSPPNMMPAIPGQPLVQVSGVIAQ